MSCYVCGSDEWSLREGRLRDAPHIGVHQCSGCGVVVAEKAHGVTIDYAAGTMHSLGPSEPVGDDPVAKQDLERRFSATAPLMNYQEPFVEIGCGDGSFLVLARENGFQGIGVEVDERSLANCINLGLEVVRELYEISEEQRLKVKACVMFHVLEHLSDPRQFIKDVRRSFPRLEHLVVEVPSADDPLLTLYNNQEFANFTYWSHHEHLHSTLSLALTVATEDSKVEISRVQRYGMANHIGWLLEGKPGGQVRFAGQISDAADENYRSFLQEGGVSDTLWCEVHFKPDSDRKDNLTFCFDIDGTICSNTDGDYMNANPYEDRIKHVNQLFDKGNKVIFMTARGSSTGVDWSEFTHLQLRQWGVKFHEVHFRKPFAHLHIDDKAQNSESYNWHY